MPAPPRCYTVPQLLEALHMKRRTFETKRAAGKLPFLEEILPRIDRHKRYRADLVDRYLAGQFKRSA